MRDRDSSRRPSKLSPLRAAAFVLVAACFGPPAQPVFAPTSDDAPTSAPERDVAGDVHSYADPSSVAVTHMSLKLRVSFAERVLDGSVTHRIDRHDASAPLRLDTRDLEIVAVETATGPTPDRLAEHEPAGGWQATAWTLGDSDPLLGAPLQVTLPPDATLVRVRYRTRPTATGLQWLEPAQTAGGRQPFLYSQSQSIHARSWIPCQDSPGVRATYDASIELDLPLVALMAAQAIETPPAAERRFAFEMRRPIPAYLLALAAGDVAFRKLSPRTGVWAEPTMLDRAANELIDVEAMLRVAETLCGPYRWDRYDVLVLPPAFPFGGMENPRLTFVTPTVLAGDRSLVSLIAHELAHSWSGNLVTGATWADFWLNEGFTVYVERRIVETLYGRRRAELEAALGHEDLLAAIDEVDDRDERLWPDLRGRDPDTALGDVSYEKGALLLRQLEEVYGREVVDPFLRKWFDAHALTSVTTAQLEAFVRDELVEVAQPRPGLRPPPVHAWIHEPGIPAGAIVPGPQVFAAVDAELAALVDGTRAAKDVQAAGWTPQEWVHFLRALPASVPASTLADLDTTHGLTLRDNAEVLACWLAVAVAHGHRGVDERLEAFLVEVGRSRYVEPIYEALVAAGRTADAKRIYGKARPGYHAITRATVDHVVAWSPS